MGSNRNGYLASAAIALALTQTAQAAPPPNDDVHNATVVPSVPYSAFVDMPQATVSPSDPLTCTDIYSNNNTVWYRYTPAASGSVDIHLEPAPNQSLSAFLGVFTGTPDALVPVKCSDFYTEPSNTTRLPVTAGLPYYIEAGAIFKLASSQTGTFSMVTSPPVTAGTLSVTPAASSYRVLKYDIETFFYVVYHVVIDVNITCAPGLASVKINAQVDQGESSTSGTGYTASCAAGSATVTLDIAPPGPYGHEAFVSGPALATVTAYNFDKNYKVSVTNAPINITAERRVR